MPKVVMFIALVVGTSAQQVSSHELPHGVTGMQIQSSEVETRRINWEDKIVLGEQVRPRRLPPGYRIWITRNDSTSPPDSEKTVVAVSADDGAPVLRGTVHSVGQHGQLLVVDYFLREQFGPVVHADRHSIAVVAWKHYEMSVGWWDRYVTHHITTWAVIVALTLGVIGVFSRWLPS